MILKVAQINWCILDSKVINRIWKVKVQPFALCQFTDIVECTNDTCSGNGNCTELVGGGTECECSSGWIGANCETG